MSPRSLRILRQDPEYGIPVLMKRRIVAEDDLDWRIEVGEWLGGGS
jgi:hypothetical protein